MVIVDDVDEMDEAYKIVMEEMFRDRVCGVQNPRIASPIETRIHNFEEEEQ